MSPPFPLKPSKLPSKQGLSDQPQKHTSLYSLNPLYVNIIIYLVEVQGYHIQRLSDEEVVKRLYKGKPCNLNQLDTELAHLRGTRKEFPEMSITGKK